MYLINILDLPPEIILMVLDYLELLDSVLFASTCKLINNIFNSDIYWKNKIKKNYPEEQMDDLNYKNTYRILSTKGFYLSDAESSKIPELFTNDIKILLTNKRTNYLFTMPIFYFGPGNIDFLNNNGTIYRYRFHANDIIEYNVSVKTIIYNKRESDFILQDTNNYWCLTDKEYSIKTKLPMFLKNVSAFKHTYIRMYRDIVYLIMADDKLYLLDENYNLKKTNLICYDVKKIKKFLFYFVFISNFYETYYDLNCETGSFKFIETRPLKHKITRKSSDVSPNYTLFLR